MKRTVNTRGKVSRIFTVYDIEVSVFNPKTEAIEKLTVSGIVATTEKEAVKKALKNEKITAYPTVLNNKVLTTTDVLCAMDVAKFYELAEKYTNTEEEK